MTYQIPRRNVTFTDEYMTTANDERVTIRRCYEDGQPTVTKVFLNGWQYREYKTAAGLQAFLGRVGVRTPDAATLEAYEQGATP